MKKILENLKFPLIAIAIICAIYGGLNLQDLQSKAKASKNQNQDLVFQNNEITSRLSKLENALALITEENNNLKTEVSQSKDQLALAQKQIAKLSVPKMVLGESTTNLPAPTPDPIVITKTETKTKTVVKEVEKNQAIVTVSGVGSFPVDLKSGDNAFTVLKRAMAEHGLPLEYQEYSFGVFVTSIGGVPAGGNQFWAFYYNGAFSNVGASEQPIKKGDTTFWQLANF